MRRVQQATTLAATLILLACSGGGSGSSSPSGFLGGSGVPGMLNMRVCDGLCSRQQLSQEQVATVVQQAVNEANARGVAGMTVAVTDRVGNPLAIYEMGNAPQTVAIGSNERLFGEPGVNGFPGNGLEDVPGGANLGSADVSAVPATVAGGSLAVISARLAALSKAGTAAYLSTQGNAFTTRTASQIIQEHFNPGEFMQAGGPLFGVQFSQLPCGDIARRSPIVFPPSGTAGPKSLPLGFSGDSGGIPLYIQGDMVGAVGIEVNGSYSVDKRTADDDVDVEELIALASQRSFEPNSARQADNITVMGKLFRYMDVGKPGAPGPISPALTSLATSVTGASLVSITDIMGNPTFFDAAGGIRSGTRFLEAASGYLGLDGASGGYFGRNQDSRILVNPDGSPFLGLNVLDPATDPNALQVPPPVTNPRASFSPVPANGGLTATEAAIIASNGVAVAQRSRAQIRNGIQGPGFPFMQVNVSVVDLAGNLIAFAGTQDAPVFGTTVSIQKARTAAFISRDDNGADPNMPTSAAVDMMADVELADPLGIGAQFQTQSIGQYVTDVRAFVVDPTALDNGIAFSDRSGGNLSRPFFPDGIDGNPHGPFSKPIETWSPFNTGLQLDLILDRLLIGLFTEPLQGGDVRTARCTGDTLLEVRGGIQIFPGSVPIFKDGQLVGGMGISGDGVDQDDLVAFEGVKQAGIEMGGNGIGGPGMVGNAPEAVRSDTLRVNVPGAESGFLRYVNCPPTPFLADNSQNVCEN